MRPETFDMLLLIVIGMMIGAFICLPITANSFQREKRQIIDNYEALLDVIDRDNPGYFDNVLSETDEWAKIYDE